MESDSRLQLLVAGAMPIEVPRIGAVEETYRITAWFVEVGERVEEGDRLFEMLVPGVTCDVPSLVGGTIVRIDKGLDSIARGGETVAWILPSARD